MFSIIIVSGQVKSTNVQTIDGKKFYIHKIEKARACTPFKLYNVSLDQLYVINPELKLGAKAGQEIKVPYNALSNAAFSSTLSPGQASQGLFRY